MPVRLPVAAALLCASTSAALAQQGLEFGEDLFDRVEVIFMQKVKSAYACEFVNVSTTRCRPIN